MRADSSAPKANVPALMSSRLAPAPSMTGVPGAAVSITAAVPRNSATFMATVPATVIGAVPPAIGIG